MRRPVIALLATLLFGLAGPLVPARAGPPSPCDFNICTVANEVEFLQALSELNGQNVGVSRIDLTAGFIIQPASNPTYSGVRPLIIDGNGFTLDGNGTAQIFTNSSTQTLSFLDITIDSGKGSSGTAAITSTGDVLVNDSVLSFNISESNGGTQSGGAIRGFARVEIHDSVVTNNRSLNSAGTARGGAVVANGEIFVAGSTVTDNLADATPSGLGRGGAFDTNANVEIQTSTVRGNTAKGTSAQGGAVYSGTTTEITDSTVETNRAESSTSGATGGAVNAAADVTITRSVLDDNEAKAAQLASGGAVHVDAGDVHVDDSLLIENDAKATNSAGRGGAIGSLNNIDVEVRRSTLQDNNAVSTNSTTRGGAVYVTSGSVLLEESAVVRNAAQGSGGAGGGISAGTATVSASDSTLAGNIADVGGAVAGGGGIQLRFATVSDNFAPSGAQLEAPTSLLSSAASVVAQPAGVGTVNCSVANGVSQVASYEDDDTCGFDDGPTDVENVADMRLGPPRDNGGDQTGPAELTPAPRTRLSVYPLLGSPVVDAIQPADCNTAFDGNALFLDDQRGLDRPAPGLCDVGAVETPYAPHGFTDGTPFYEETIRWVTSEVNAPRILNGFPDNTFGAGLNIIRGDAARLYYRAAGAPDVSGLPGHGFTDVPPFYEDAVRWAKANGVFNGFGDDTFRHQLPITRADYTRSLYGFVGNPDNDLNGVPPHPFSDVTPFYEDAVRWAKGNGLADGFAGDTYRLGDQIIRGNASRIFYNTAQSPDAWDQGGIGAPDNMLFRSNLD